MDWHKFFWRCIAIRKRLSWAGRYLCLPCAHIVRQSKCPGKIREPALEALDFPAQSPSNGRFWTQKFPDKHSNLQFALRLPVGLGKSLHRQREEPFPVEWSPAGGKAAVLGGGLRSLCWFLAYWPAAENSPGSTGSPGIIVIDILLMFIRCVDAGFCVFNEVVPFNAADVRKFTMPAGNLTLKEIR